MAKLLILGGTSEGRSLAENLAAALPELEVITALAGATTAQPDLPGHVRVGGFGGASGLAAYLKDQGVTCVIDATHPFAATMTANAVEACTQTEIPYLRLDRKQWTMPKDTDVIFVPDAEEAARLIARTSSAAFITVGRKALGAFQGLSDVKLLVRLIEEPSDDLGLKRATFITGRPPFDADSEEALMRKHQIDTLVTKASGGNATRGKIDAAARIGARIVLIRRPAPPDATPNSERVFSVDEAIKWISSYI